MTALIFRTFPYRMFGYGFPLAEALYFSFDENHWLIDVSYSISGAFILGHVFCETFPALWHGELGLVRSLSLGLATLLWEVLASVLLPSIVVNQICHVVKRFCPEDLKFIPTISGIVVLPVIVAPLDAASDMIVYFFMPMLNVMAQ